MPSPVSRAPQPQREHIVVAFVAVVAFALLFTASFAVIRRGPRPHHGSTAATTSVTTATATHSLTAAKAAIDACDTNRAATKGAARLHDFMTGGTAGEVAALLDNLGRDPAPWDALRPDDQVVTCFYTPTAGSHPIVTYVDAAGHHSLAPFN